MRYVSKHLTGAAVALPLVIGGTAGLRRRHVDTAANAGSFDTLVAAAEAAGLVETLKGEGPFTVFAPTDEAFGGCPRARSTVCSSPRTRISWSRF